MKTLLAPLVSIVLACFISSTSGYCGDHIKVVDPKGGNGWGASGGELHGDSQNPWWLQNVSEVTYCIDVDTASISVTPEVIAASIERSLRSWKIDFSTGGSSWVGVAEQNFVKKPCSESVDLKVQFGYGTLSEEQKKFLGPIRSYVGIAVRTHYDPVQLKGKGFVYFASDLGPNSYDGGPKTVAKAWSHEFVLTSAIHHELGHVFGLSHSGTDLMSQTVFDLIFNEEIVAFLEGQGFRLPEVLRYLTPGETVSRCESPKLPEGVRNYFEIPESERCLEVTKSDEGYAFYSRASARASATFRGKLDGKYFGGSGNIVSWVKLNPSQTVFPNNIGTFDSLPSVTKQKFTISGFMTTASGKMKPLEVHQQVDDMELKGIDSSGVIRNLFSTMTGGQRSQTLFGMSVQERQF